MKRILFTFKQADSKTRLSGIIALAIALAAILMLIISASSAINGSFTNLPVMSLAFDDDELETIEEEYDEYLEELEDLLDDADDDELDDFEDEYGITLEEAVDILPEKISLGAMSDAVDLLGGPLGLSKADTEIFDIIIGWITWSAVILCLLVALSAFLMNKPSFIVAASIAFPFFLIFVGVLWLFVFIGLCVAYCIMVHKVQVAYKLSVAGAAPQAPAYAAPNGYAPNGYAPNGYAPNGYAPNANVPNNGYAPNGYAPNGYAPNAQDQNTQNNQNGQN